MGVSKNTLVKIRLVIGLLVSVELISFFIFFQYSVSKQTLAAISAQYTNNQAPVARFNASSINNLVLDVTIPDAWNGVSYTADIVQKSGSIAYYQGQTLSSFTALGAIDGVGYRENGTAGFQGTEAVVRDLDADGVYTSAADTLVDGDGSTTIGAGTVSDLIDIGGALLAMGNDIVTGGYALCVNSLTSPTAVRIDTNGDCTNGNKKQGVYVLGTSAISADVEVTNAWVWADSVAMGGNENGTYDNGEDIFIENVVGELTYSASADVDVYSTGGLSAGNTLTNFASDCDEGGSGTTICRYTGVAPIDATRTILIDQGNAGGAAPNGVADTQADRLLGLGIQSEGTAINSTDISAVKLWSESGVTPGFQSEEDVLFGTMTVSTLDNRGWRIGSLSTSIPSGGLRLYVTANIAAAATNNTTLLFQLPVYNDAGGDDAVTQDGDVGVFVASTNDGPTDSVVLNSNIQVIDTQSPTISEYTTVPDPTNDSTPNYTFLSSEAGDITYVGDCSSTTTSASAGANTITFDTLSQGIHSNCAIRVTDEAGNQSNLLNISSFTVDTTAPTIAEVTPVPTQTNDQTPNYTFNSTEAGIITYTGDCSSTTTAVSGNNTVTFNPLTEGLHSGCTVRVVDTAGNESNIVTISAFTIDISEPVLAEVIPVPIETNDPTPDYTFISTEAGTITYGGACSSATTNASAGSNTVTINNLSDGTYADCTLLITDFAGNPSSTLTMSSFTVHTHEGKVLNVSSNNVNGTYGVGADISIFITIDEDVYVTGSPRILMETGTTDRYAYYESGSGSDTLVFDYYPQSGDFSSDLDYVGTNSLELNSGAIKDYAGNDTNVTLPFPGTSGSLSANKDIVINTITPDTTPPTVTNIYSSKPDGAYPLDEVITITIHWSENVNITGTPTLTLNTAPSTGIASYTSGSGNHETIFTYRVGGDQYVDDLDYANISALSLAGGTIKDLSGNNADITLIAPGTAGSLAANNNIKVDSINPEISEVDPVPSYTNDTTPSYIFLASEAATILYVGDCSSVITSAADGDNTITFNALAEGEHSNCTIQLKDAAENLSNTLSVSTFTIDTDSPDITNVTSSKENGTYGRDVIIPIQITFDEIVIVAVGIPLLDLETGVTDAQAAYVSGSGTAELIFNYTTAYPELTSDLDYINTSSLLCCGSIIQDQAGNNANLNLPMPGDSGSLSDNKDLGVHTHIPVLTEVTPVYSPTTDITPEYTFNTTEVGTITYGGDCASVSTSAIVGDNTITFNKLELAAYNNCTITVTDPYGNPSEPLLVTPFSVTSAGHSIEFLDYLISGINLIKRAEPDVLQNVGEGVIYKYEVSNKGNVHLHDIELTDDTCEEITYISGDTNNDQYLDLTEIWLYECEMILHKSTKNIATVKAQIDNIIVRDTAEVYVPVAENIIPPQISLVKSATPGTITLEGGDVTFTYKVFNTGNIHIENIEITDELCSAIQWGGGDLDEDQFLDPREVWQYSCKKYIDEDIYNKAQVIGSYADQEVFDEASVHIALRSKEDHQDPPKSGEDALELLGLSVHSLVKVSSHPAVYYLGADGKTHVFKNEQIYFTWYCDFLDVSFIQQSLFDQIEVGDPVTYAPGALMIKIPSDPRVYAIEKGNVIRWIVNEEVARGLYGENWSRYILDVVSLDSYKLGDAIESIDHYDPQVARQAVTYPSDTMSIETYEQSQPGLGLVCQ